MAGACANCGRPTSNEYCSTDCRRSDTDDGSIAGREYAECPYCGGITSGEGVICASCRSDEFDTAQLRDGQTRDDSHARRNAAMLAKADRVLGPEDGDSDE